MFVHWEEAAVWALTALTPWVKESWREESQNAGIAVRLDRRETRSNAGEMTDNKRDLSGI